MGDFVQFKISNRTSSFVKCFRTETGPGTAPDCIRKFFMLRPMQSITTTGMVGDEWRFLKPYAHCEPVMANGEPSYYVAIDGDEAVLTNMPE